MLCTFRLNYSITVEREVDVIKLTLIPGYFQQVQEHFYLIYHLNSRLSRTESHYKCI